MQQNPRKQDKNRKYYQKLKISKKNPNILPKSNRNTTKSQGTQKIQENTKKYKTKNKLNKNCKNTNNSTKQEYKTHK